ncbi:hypothetical protein J5N97_021869 [Dioscorea zingiberensis]|uniref:RING-type domain-containing protein n=1 Tax=Dioscorea zingiberensis TaxID=325984 RepID=A0A9D5C935_9LILI|nr:hypothetical protein J5N97_021869 [Dioscorea zingiberensis]
MDVKKNKNIVSNKEKKIKNIPEGDHLMDVKKNKSIVSDKEKKIENIPEGDHLMDVEKNKSIVSEKEKKIENIPEGDHLMDAKKNKNIVSNKEKKIKNIREGDHLMDAKKNKNIVSNKEKKIKNIPEGDHLMDVKKSKDIVSNNEKKIKNNISQIVDHNTHLQDGKLSNPIDVENFNSGKRGRHWSLPIVVDTEDTEEGGQEDPIAVDEIERIVRQKADGRNQPILVEDDDDDDDLLGFVIMVSLSDMDDRMGKRTARAIDSYVDVFDCEYVGESSYSRKREMVDCGICMEEVDKYEMFNIIGCAHRYCASCVSSYIT